MDEQLVRKLAMTFCKVLEDWLSPREWKTLTSGELMGQRGDHPADYCDANMAMEEAFIKVRGRCPWHEEEIGEGYCTKEEHQADIDLWNAAYNLADRHNYKLEEA